MNRILRALAATTAAACAGVTLVGAPAQAASRVGGDQCTDRGTTNYYVHHWQPIHPRQILNSPFVFHERKCEVAGFRLYKSVANTAGEADFQRRFLASDRPKKPTIYCRTAHDHAYFLDLSFYWGIAGIKHLNAAERDHYSSWAREYARNHDCRLFVPSK